MKKLIDFITRFLSSFENVVTNENYRIHINGIDIGDSNTLVADETLKTVYRYLSRDSHNHFVLVRENGEKRKLKNPMAYLEFLKVGDSI